MKVEIEIDDKELMQCVKQLIAKKLIDTFSCDRNMYKSEIAQAVRDIIYADKENIINTTVARASQEVKIKAIKKLLDTQ